ncbi:MAG TPA: type II toxin-antitoxin system VapC family toxin [Microbacteriaceae bacterium]
MIVIESSALVDALVGNPANPELLALIADSELHAPSLIDYEVASALRGHSLGGKLADVQLQDAADDFSALDIERYPLAAMIRDVLDLRDNFTVYDAAYIVLAQALDAALVTADAKLSEARKFGVDVHVLQPPS